MYWFEVLIRDIFNRIFCMRKNHYTFRNYSSCISSGNDMWHVAGTDTIGNFGSGVLEWCSSEEDAKEVMERMKKDLFRFKNLNIGNVNTIY